MPQSPILPGSDHSDTTGFSSNQDGGAGAGTREKCITRSRVKTPTVLGSMGVAKTLKGSACANAPFARSHPAASGCCPCVPQRRRAQQARGAIALWPAGGSGKKSALRGLARGMWRKAEERICKQANKRQEKSHWKRHPEAPLNPLPACAGAQANPSAQAPCASPLVAQFAAQNFSYRGLGQFVPELNDLGLLVASQVLLAVGAHLFLGQIG